MVNIENLFNNAFCAIRAHPKLLLPFTLNWLPQAVITVVFSLIARDIVSGYNLAGLLSIIKSDPMGFFVTFLNTHAYHFGLILLAGLVSIFINSFVRTIYPALSYQIYYRRNIELKQALEVAKNRYLKVLWTTIVFDTLVIISIFGTVILGISIAVLLTSIAGVIGMILGILTSIAAIVIMFILLVQLSAIGVLVEPIVVIEKLSGIKAIKKSYTIIKGKLTEILIFILFVVIANGLYFAMSGWITGLLGFVLGDYTSLIQMMLMLLPSTFILLSYGLLYLEISPVSMNLSDSPPKTC